MKIGGPVGGGIDRAVDLRRGGGNGGEKRNKGEGGKNRVFVGFHRNLSLRFVDRPASGVWFRLRLELLSRVSVNHFSLGF